MWPPRRDHVCCLLACFCCKRRLRHLKPHLRRFDNVDVVYVYVILNHVYVIIKHVYVIFKHVYVVLIT